MILGQTMPVLDDVRLRTARSVFHLGDRDDPSPTQRALIDTVFDWLGVSAVIDSTQRVDSRGWYKPSKTKDDIKRQYDIWQDFFVLDSDIGQGATLLLAYDVFGGQNKLIATSPILQTRDLEEFYVLKELCARGEFDTEGFRHIYDSERPERRFEVPRHLRVTRELDQETLTQPDSLAASLRTVATTYQRFNDYQQERAVARTRIVDRLLGK